MPCFLRALLVLASLVSWASSATAGPSATDGRIRVDQFGWRPGQEKVAVISSPQVGFNAPDPYPAPVAIEVRRWDDDSVATTVITSSWNGGGTDAQSGDQAWLVDFSALTEEGSFYLWDPAAAVGSHRFEIAEDVHAAVLDAALKSLLYQRCGTPKLPEHAGADWEDTACHVGLDQDLACAPNQPPWPGLGALDLHGGWHDAGDYNKYVNFADGPVHDLLAAWQEAPAVFTDSLGIPESGNGIPDVLDEARWELDWLLRMQADGLDGAVLHKVSVTDFATASPPSADAAPRRYGPATASATISSCGVFAHAATVFRSLGLPEADAYADTLEAAALSAWDVLEAFPGGVPSNYDNAGFSSAAAEDDAYSQAANRTAAAVYLAELTGEQRFHDHVDATYRDVHLLQWGFVYPFEPENQDALLYYTGVPGARAQTVRMIQNAYLGSIAGGDNLDHHRNRDDPYGAWLGTDDYVWGTNRTKSHAGLMYLLAKRHGLDPALDAEFEAAGARYLHGLHGVNPSGLVFLTNMAALGAESSCTQIYHGWFADGTDWDQTGVSAIGPPPGIVPGGANPHFAPDPSYMGPVLEPPQNQPVQKSYLDWNTSWPENSWEITENQVSYQAAYIRLLANLVERGAVAPDPEITTQPLAADACESGSAFFEVVATGEAPLQHRWRRDGAPLAEGAPYTGTDTARLDIDPVAAALAGSFDVVVTDGSGRQVTSDAAALTVSPVLEAIDGRLRAWRRGAGDELAWPATAGTDDYSVQRCDASAGDCVPMEAAVTAATVHPIADTGATLTWFRVLSQGPCP